MACCRSSARQPTILILDKEIQALPWEGLACYQGKRPQPFTRVPSLSFLQACSLFTFYKLVLCTFLLFEKTIFFLVWIKLVAINILMNCCLQRFILHYRHSAVSNLSNLSFKSLDWNNEISNIVLGFVRQPQSASTWRRSHSEGSHLLRSQSRQKSGQNPGRLSSMF